MHNLIGVDNDGTLFRGDSTISKRTKEYFRYYIDNGGLIIKD